MKMKTLSPILLSILLLTSGAMAQDREDREKAREQVRKAAPGLESVAPKSAADVAKELANPATPLSSLGNHLEYRSFKGDLPGADDQDSWVYSFQPSFPFSIGEGAILALRPAIPIILKQPVFDAGEGAFSDKGVELGDISFDFVYGKTSKTGLITMGGLFGILPTATDSAVGSDQWRLGPEALIGIARPWGVVGGLIFHQWDVAGGDEEPGTSITSINYLYAIGLGGAYQLAAGPTITYDWNAEDGQEWTVPLGVGLAKTVIMGSTPVKLQAQVFYYVEQPDAFGPEWGFKLSFSPVVKNPFARGK